MNRAADPPLRVILNADDFGRDEDTCRETVACFERGILSSASIMPTMPATSAACEYATRHPEFSYGVHLTFVRETCEAPAAPLRSIRTLVDATGRFRSVHEVRARALAGLVSENDIACEIEAQLRRVRDCGVTITHVDTHGQVHEIPVFARALARTLPRFGVRRIRNVRNVYLRPPWCEPSCWVAKMCAPIEGGPWRTTEWFYTPCASARTQWPERLLRRSWTGTMEIAVHPGREEAWRNRERTEAARLRELLRDRCIPVVPWAAV
ncbi:MAG: carbohydrate deacetylase [Rhodospirillaceae bacterium]